jgi:3-oxoadipate enol-lactonase/4-carboxymuconolactone decarboxylase
MIRLLILGLCTWLAAGGAAAADTDGEAAAAEGKKKEFEMVLVHGLGSNAKVWDEAAPYLGGPFEVWRFELAGHGTTAPVDQPTVASEAERLGAFLDANGIDYPTLVGHGLGGMIALRYALDNPARVHRLVVIDAAARQLASPAEQLELAASLKTDYDRTVAGRCLNLSPDPAITDRIIDDALRTDSASYVSLLMSTADYDMTPELPGLTVPLLVVGSELMFPAEVDSRHILQHLGFDHTRSLSFKRIANAGHYIMLERPVYTASVLMAFGVTPGYEFGQP